MLTGTGLGDDARAAHPAREQDLTQAIVDLVRAGVIEFFALEIDFRPHAFWRRGAQRLGQALGVIERAGAADIMLEEIVELGLERRIGLGRAIFALQFQDEGHQGFGDIAPAEVAEMARRIGLLAEGIGKGHKRSAA